MSGESWLLNIECPRSFDFEAALTTPVIEETDKNPPLIASVWDSDDESREFFSKLEKDSSKRYPSRPQSKNSIPTKDIKNIGPPKYYHRPDIPFEQYLEQQNQKQRQQQDENDILALNNLSIQEGNEIEKLDDEQSKTPTITTIHRKHLSFHSHKLPVRLNSPDTDPLQAADKSYRSSKKSLTNNRASRIQSFNHQHNANSNKNAPSRSRPKSLASSHFSKSLKASPNTINRSANLERSVSSKKNLNKASSSSTTTKASTTDVRLDSSDDRNLPRVARLALSRALNSRKTRPTDGPKSLSNPTTKSVNTTRIPQRIAITSHQTQAPRRKVAPSNFTHKKMPSNPSMLMRSKSYNERGATNSKANNIPKSKHVGSGNMMKNSSVNPNVVKRQRLQRSKSEYHPLSSTLSKQRVIVANKSMEKEPLVNEAKQSEKESKESKKIELLPSETKLNIEDIEEATNNENDQDCLESLLSSMLKARNSAVLEKRNMDKSERNKSLEIRRQTALKSFQKDKATESTEASIPTARALTQSRQIKNTQQIHIKSNKPAVSRTHSSKENANRVARATISVRRTTTSTSKSSDSKQNENQAAVQTHSRMQNRVKSMSSQTLTKNGQLVLQRKSVGRGLTGFRSRSKSVSIFTRPVAASENSNDGASTIKPLRKISDNELQSVLEKHNQQVTGRRLMGITTRR